MPKKKKNELPSGNIRIQVYDYTDVDGKKHYKSFTAPTRQEAKYLAAQWKAGKAEKKPTRITLYEAVTRYIEAKEGVLSPSTIREYMGMQERRMKEIGRIWLDELNSTDVQVWISSVSKELSPKSVRNLYGLLSAAVEMFAPDLRLKVTLPEKTITKANLPHFRFHDLRHYAASIMHAIGIPDQYILQQGGWASDNIMKSVYRNMIDIETVRQNKKINEHFQKMAHNPV